MARFVGLFTTQRLLFFSGIFGWFQRICTNEQQFCRVEFDKSERRLLELEA